MQKKRVAIIGANGFVGLSVSKALAKKGYLVHALIRDNFSGNKKIYNNLSIKTLIVGDLENIKKINLKGNQFDYVINLAARAHVKKKISADAKKTINKLSNIEKNIVKNFNIKTIKLIQLSSAKVKLIESKNKLDDSEFIYIKAKLKSEEIIRNNLSNYIILRPPLIYGPNVKANFLALIKAIDYRLPLPFLKVENLRSYLYIENLVDLILTVIEKNHFSNNYYYICDGNPISTKKICDVIAKYLFKKPRYFYLNNNILYFLAKTVNKENLLNKVIGDFVISNKKINKDLGWRPKYNLNSGIKNTCFWYKTMFKMNV